MKIMSFNTQHCLNFLEQRIDYDIMADAIKKCSADIVGLNEMRSDDTNVRYDRQAQILSELTGMKYHYFAKAINVSDNEASYAYGNAMISKYPIVKAQTIRIPDVEGKRYESRCLLKAWLEGGITVLVTHFGLTDAEQKNAVETVIENLENDKCILMGDFNAIPEAEVLNPIRKRMKDTAQCFDRELLSFPSDKPDRKIDYIFVSHDIEVVSADIPSIIASDHRPHIADVKIR